MTTLLQAASPGDPWLFHLFNITSWWGVAWVTVGFGGQLLFTLRLTVQWLVSEKHRKSVVPTSYWWLSIGGAAMLVAYFLWRRDVVGVMGQAFGFFIYVRNLYLIRAHREAEEVLV